MAFLVRSTTTWNEPLAAWNRLSAVIDFSSTGWLRTEVLSPNGLRSWGSRWTADSATQQRGGRGDRGDQRRHPADQAAAPRGVRRAVAVRPADWPRIAGEARHGASVLPATVLGPRWGNCHRAAINYPARPVLRTRLAWPPPKWAPEWLGS